MLENQNCSFSDRKIIDIISLEIFDAEVTLCATIAWQCPIHNGFNCWYRCESGIAIYARRDPVS